MEHTITILSGALIVKISWDRSSPRPPVGQHQVIKPFFDPLGLAAAQYVMYLRRKFLTLGERERNNCSGPNWGL